MQSRALSRSTARVATAIPEIYGLASINLCHCSSDLQCAETYIFAKVQVVGYMLHGPILQLNVNINFKCSIASPSELEWWLLYMNY